MNDKLERKYGLFTAICMVVGIVIGSGVFFKAQTILIKTGGDMPLAIVAWIIGGAIMLVCLLTFSFMGVKTGNALSAFPFRSRPAACWWPSTVPPCTSR